MCKDNKISKKTYHDKQKTQQVIGFKNVSFALMSQGEAVTLVCWVVSQESMCKDQHVRDVSIS